MKVEFEILFLVLFNILLQTLPLKLIKIAETEDFK